MKLPQQLPATNRTARTTAAIEAGSAAVGASTLMRDILLGILDRPGK